MGQFSLVSQLRTPCFIIQKFEVKKI